MLDSYRDLIDGLLNTPTTLRSALGTPVPDEVSPEVATLLREVRVREAVNLRRMQAAMRDTGTLMLLSIEDEREMQALANGEPAGTPEEAMASFSHDRSELISLLVNLTLKDWEKSVNHDRSGDTSIADEIDDHLTWDEAMVERLTA